MTPEMLLDSMGMLVQVMDYAGSLIHVNQEWLRVLGYAAVSSEPDNFIDTILHVSYRETMKSEWLPRLQAGQRLDVNMMVRSRSGDSVVLDGQLIPMGGDEHQPAVVMGVFKDITHHKTMADEMEHMFMLSVDMLGVADYAGNLLRLNPAWERVLGYHLDELVGHSLFEFVHPDDVIATQEQVERSVQGDAIRGFENRYRCKDGGYKWLSWTSVTHHLENRTYFVARDVTAMKQDQERFVEAKRQLQAIMDNSTAMISVKDSNGQYILVNKQFEILFGMKPEDIVGKTDVDIFDREISRPLRAHDREVLEVGTSMQFEEILPGIDGLHTYLATKFPLLDEGGQVYGIGSIATDITYRKLTEMQLALRNRAIESSPTGVSIADCSLPDMPLIYVNPTFERITGYSALDAIGQNCRFLQADDREQPAIQTIRDAIQQEEPCKVVLRNYRKDGSLFYNELRLAPIHDGLGRLSHYVGISMDVTSRVHADEKIHSQNEALLRANRALAQARKQAEDATRLKSQFLATMSHELRTPLNAIIGYTEIQLAGMTGELTSEQRDYQERVVANADHLLELINDVLDISKIEAGRMEVVNKQFDLRQWLDEVVAQTQGLAETKGLDFQVEVDERMPVRIVTDPARLKQITINLLSNAFKFTSSGYVKVDIRKHGRDAWKLIVEDSGDGIPSHLQETIFEEFRQADSSSQRRQGGTGLGLSIVRKLALMIGGNVRVRSQVGQGSTFTVILPLVETEMHDGYLQQRSQHDDE